MANALNNPVLETGWRECKRSWIATTASRCGCAGITVSILAVSVFSLGAQTQIDLASQGKRVDFSGASTTKPSKMGTALPGTCSTGETFFKMDAVPGQNLYGCTATNVWTQMSSASSLPPVSGQSNKILSNDGTTSQWRSLGGDLSGAPNAATVARIQGRLVGSTAPIDGQALVWSNALGRWEPGLAGEGGGGIAPWTVSQASATELSIASGPAVRFGNYVCTQPLGPAMATLISGTGTVYIYVSSGCALTVAHNVVMSGCSGCSLTSGTSFPAGSFPIAEWSVTAGQFADTGIPLVTAYGMRPLAAGANVQIVESNGTATISASGGVALDYTPTRNSATELGLGAIAANAYRVGEAGCAAVGASTFTVASGTGTLWVAVGSDCTVKVRHNVLGACSATCTAVASSTGFDPGDLPLYQWTVTSGALAATGTGKLTPYVSRPLVAGTNVSFAHTAGVTTISAAAAFDPLDLSVGWVRDEFICGSDGLAGSVNSVRIVGSLGWGREPDASSLVCNATNLGARHVGIAPPDKSVRGDRRCSSV